MSDAVKDLYQGYRGPCLEVMKRFDDHGVVRGACQRPPGASSRGSCCPGPRPATSSTWS